MLPKKFLVDVFKFLKRLSFIIKKFYKLKLQLNLNNVEELV